MVYFLIFLVLFVIAFFLRAQETVFNNYLFLIDMGRDMMAVKGIIYDHHLTLIGPHTSLGGVFQGPGWYYLLSIPTLILRGDPWGSVVLMLMISLTVGITSFWFVNKFFGFWAGITSFFLTAISPEAIAAATYSWNPHPMWLLITFYIFFLFLIAMGRQKFHFVLWPTITLMTHFQTALAVFLFASTLIYLILRWKFNIKRCLLLGLIFSSIFLLPQALFDLRHDFLISRGVIALIKGEDRGLAVSKNEKSKNLINVHKDQFINNFKSSFLNYDYNPNFPFILAGACLIILILRKKDFNSRETLFIKTTLSIPVIVFAISLFYPFPLRYWFFTGFQMFYILPAGLVLSKLFNIRLGRIIVILFLISIVPLISGRIKWLYIENPNDINVGKVNAIKMAVDYIYQDAKREKFGLLVFAPPVYTPNYDYIVWWYGKNKYGYLPHSEKEGIFYLLMEPDPNKPSSYEGWLETVIKTGKTLKQEKLESGLIVEKRKADN